jgi:hypothetical protein
MLGISQPGIDVIVEYLKPANCVINACEQCVYGSYEEDDKDDEALSPVVSAEEEKETHQQESPGGGNDTASRRG